MTAPRKSIPICSRCHQPAISGLVGAECWSCAFPARLSVAALAEVRVQEQERFALNHITR